MKRLSFPQAYRGLLAAALASSALAIAPLGADASQIAGGNIGAVGTSASPSPSPSPSRGSSTNSPAPGARGKAAASGASAPGKAASSARKG